ncbi:conserved hypothetical protein [Ricinus communis]|uniref:Uncharacterized protein n=1 Tax=Ricinus communis TaxID=3988 RepID=B9SX73_RICCO|nr:conserved hypothetical protein [Ricinus communis]
MAAPTLPNLLLSHAFLLLLTIITTTSSPSLASQPSNFHRPPRFLGKFSHKIKPPPSSSSSSSSS